EWVCPEHSSWARKKFEKWWSDRSNDPPPKTVDLAVKLADAGSLSIPTSIVVRKVGGERFDRIIKHALPPDKPPAIGESIAVESPCLDCFHSCYDNDFSLVCREGWVAGGPCSHFECNADIDGVPF
ncbi:MAG: hypothetical protein FWD31_13085, partial [Planctomycetaceae bacterium]|nr:hypothetical protein [Planctomycetaceae bacterium]